MKDLWLSKKIYTEWPIYSQGGSTNEEEPIARAYEIWERASNLMLGAKNNFDLSDTVLTLKRSVYQRLRLIEATYRLKEKSFDGKPKHYLEILAHLGIIRPLLFQSLFEIRNSIEHEDIEPPTKERCAELVDIVWYFLKSTDTMVALQKNGFEAEQGTKYGYDLEINWESGVIEISGWFPIEFISEDEKAGFVKLQVKKIETKDAFNKDGEMKKYHDNKSKTDTWLIGELQPTPIDLLELYKKLFNLYF